MNKRDTDKFFNLGIEPHNENEEDKNRDSELEFDDVMHDSHAGKSKNSKKKITPKNSKKFDEIKLNYTQEVKNVGMLGIAFKILLRFILVLLVAFGLFSVGFGGFYIYKQQKSMKVELESLQNKLAVSNETLTESSEDIVEKMTSILSSLTANTHSLSSDLLILKQKLQKVETAIKKEINNSNANNRKINASNQENLRLTNDALAQQQKYLQELVKSITSNEVSIELLFTEVNNFKKTKTSINQKFNKLNEAINVINLHRKSLTQDIASIQKDIIGIRKNTTHIQKNINSTKASISKLEDKGKMLELKLQPTK